ncbi:MAG TPA: DUF721 domain-containing protein [Rectinemataceae bacterium]
MADSRIKSASDLVAAFFDTETRAKGERIAGFWNSWSALAGSRLAQHSRPVDVRHGILVVEAEHQGWIQLLMFQQEKILRSIGEKYPELGLKGMAFKLGDPAPAQAGHGRGDSLERVEPPMREAEEEPPAEPGETGGSIPGAEGAAGLPPDLAAVFLRLREKSRP